MATPAVYVALPGSGLKAPFNLQNRRLTEHTTYRTYNLQNIKSVSRTHRETVTKEHNINNTRVVEITRQPIELFKILKFEGLVNSGGQAKLVIADGQVLLNGSVETQKSKKIVSGDVITFMDNTLQILLKVPLAKEGV